jgi:hypothetical protein
VKASRVFEINGIRYSTIEIDMGYLWYLKLLKGTKELLEKFSTDVSQQ